MAGAPRVAGATPMEYARSVDVGRSETVEIARLVTRAVYSPRGVDDSAAARSFVGKDCRLCTDARWHVKKKLID